MKALFGKYSKGYWLILLILLILLLVVQCINAFSEAPSQAAYEISLQNVQAVDAELARVENAFRLKLELLNTLTESYDSIHLGSPELHVGFLDKLMEGFISEDAAVLNYCYDLRFPGTSFSRSFNYENQIDDSPHDRFIIHDKMQWVFDENANATVLYAPYYFNGSYTGYVGIRLNSENMFGNIPVGNGDQRHFFSLLDSEGKLFYAPESAATDESAVIYTEIKPILEQNDRGIITRRLNGINNLITYAALSTGQIYVEQQPKAGMTWEFNTLIILFPILAAIGLWLIQPGAGGSTAFDKIAQSIMGSEASLTPPEMNARKSAIALHMGIVFQAAGLLLYECLNFSSFIFFSIYAVFLALSLIALTIYRKPVLSMRENIVLISMCMLCPIIIYLYGVLTSRTDSTGALLLILSPLMLGLFLFKSNVARIIFGAFSVSLFVMLVQSVVQPGFTHHYDMLFAFFISLYALGFCIFTAMDMYAGKATSDYYALIGAIDKLKETQSLLVHHEKMVTLGQLIAGVAHEINTPIGAIKASAETLDSLLLPAIQQVLDLGRELTHDDMEDFKFFVDLAVASFDEMNTSISVRRAKNELRKFFEEKGMDAVYLSDTLARLEVVDTKKIKENLHIFQKPHCKDILAILVPLIPLINGTQTVLIASEKVTKIVFALRSYAHTNISGEMLSFSVIKSIDNVLILYHNQLKIGVRVNKNYDKNLPEIEGNADELGQVWTNLIQNALQAMSFKGTLTVSVGRDGEFVVVSIADTGSGIPQQEASRIFEPFYTTKPLGEGTGLGLDISRSIVERHGGTIAFTSKEGVGTTFTVRLPIKQLTQEIQVN